MNHKRTIVGCLALVGLLLGAVGAVAAEAPRMSVAELNTRLGEPGLVVIDARAQGDWLSSTIQVQDAVRQDPNAVAAWADAYPREQTLVAYCA